MLARALKTSLSRQCRHIGTAAGAKAARQSVPVLPDASIDTFRASAFEPGTPALLPRKTFIDIPAISKWFALAVRGIRDLKDGGNMSENAVMELNAAYLSRFGDIVVPLEISDDVRFVRVEQLLKFFLSAAASPLASNARIYLAQAPISDLPEALQLDVPTPSLALECGRGDIYSSSIWLGAAPTYTPLHRDPNPNLFVQLAGRKIVRLLAPNAGAALFARVQEEVGGSASATMRGEEMMLGAEKRALDDAVWNLEHAATTNESDECHNMDLWQAELESGDGMFIPNGWWHSIKGVGTGMTGSVNWWFR